jgi:hypothetical protein
MNSNLGFHSGLPDGLFSNQKIQIWVNFGGPRDKKVGIYYIHMSIWEYITAIRPFGNLVAIWYLFPFLVFLIKKNLATLLPLRLEKPVDPALFRQECCHDRPRGRTPRSDIHHLQKSASKSRFYETVSAKILG